MKIEKVKPYTELVYVDSHDQRHYDERSAQEAQLEINLSNWAKQIGLCQGGEWSQDMVLKEMLDDRHTLKQIFNQV